MACDPETIVTTEELANLKANIATQKEVVESLSDSTTTPDGKTIDTLQGALKKLGWESPPIAYAAAISFVSGDERKVIERNGVTYAPFASEIPFTTSGTWTGDDEDKFFAITINASGTGQLTDYVFETAATMGTLTTVGGVVIAPVLGMKFSTLGFTTENDGEKSEYVVTNEAANGTTKIDLGSGFTASELADEFKTLKYANGNKARNVSCVIRQITSGGGWDYLDDSGHRPSGFAGSITKSGDSISVPFETATSKIGAISVTPDDTFAQKITVGASVGLSSVSLKMYSDLNVYVNNESLGYVVNEFHDSSEITSIVKNADGSVTVNHPTVSSDFSNIYNSRIVSTANFGGSYFVVSQTQNSITYAQQIPLAGLISYNGSTWDVFTETLNKPTASFAGGKLTVTHEDVGYPYSPHVTSKDYAQLLATGSASETSFDVFFFDAAGVARTTPDANMRFYFTVTGRLVQAEDTKGRCWLDIGPTILDPDNVFNSSGNIWINGTLEDS